MKARALLVAPFELVALVAFVALGAGCSSSSTDAPDVAHQPGLSGTTTGAVPSGLDDGRASLEKARASIVEALAGSGVRVAPDAAVVEASITLAQGRADASWTVRVVPTADTVAFELPAPGAFATTLRAATVDGEPVTARGTARRWEIAVTPGALHVVSLQVEVRAGEADPKGGTGDGARGALGMIGGALDALEKGDVASIVPVVPVVDLSEQAGQAGQAGQVRADDDVDVFAGCWPRLVGPAVYKIAISAPADRDVDASGRRVGTQRRDGVVEHAFAGVGEIAIVSSRGRATTTSMLGEVAVTLRLPARSRRLEKDLGRALEDLATRWGAGPKELAVIAWGGDAVVVLPGVVLVPAARIADAPAGDPVDQATARGLHDDGGLGLAPKLTLSGVLVGALKNHPAEKEALSFALATAVAEQWWFGAGEGAVDTVLRRGLARAAALDVVAGKGGDKARRRALELGLRWPLHLALEQGPETETLAADPATSPIVPLKAGLFAEALGRHLSAPLMATLEARLLASPPPTLEALRAAVLAVAPRPDETRVFLERWLDERHLAEDLGPIDPEAMLEYLVTDGAVAGLSSQLMNELGPGQLGGRALELLKQGHGLDAGLALTLLGELAGNEIEDPSIKKWLAVGTGMFGSEADKKKAIDALVDELGTQLGVPEGDRSRLRQLSTLLIEQLGKEAPPSPASPPAPPPPAPAPQEDTGTP